MTLSKKIAGGLFKQKALVVVILLLVFMAFSYPEFFSSFNLTDMLKQASVNEIIAFGITIVIICGACDLSVGGIMCLSGILAILLMNVMPIWIAILIAIGSGAVIGFINGFFVVKQKTEPFIITLGMGMLLKGVCQQLTDAKPIQPTNQEFMELANAKIFGVIPNIVVMMILVFLAVFVLRAIRPLAGTVTRSAGDYSVAQYSGINVIRTKWIAFVLVRHHNGSCRSDVVLADEFRSLYLWGQYRNACKLQRSCRRNVVCRRHWRRVAVCIRYARFSYSVQLHEPDGHLPVRSTSGTGNCHCGDYLAGLFYS